MRGFLKSLLVFAIACGLGLGALEIGATVAYRVARGRAFSRSEILGRLLNDRVAGDDSGELAGLALDSAVPDQPVILHPYFGFVINPEKPGVNELGFFGESPLTKRAPGKIVVAFFGGSVADQVYYLGQNALRDALRAREDFTGQEIEVVSTAIGGYKQPQQMLVLSYLLSLGAEFDVVVNLDGFNEIDSAHDNVMTGVYPYFPHTWKLHGRRAIDPAANAALGRIEIAREERQSLRQRFSSPLLRWSRFALILWDLLDGGLAADIRGQSARLEARLDDSDLPAQIRGPAFAYADDEQMYREMARQWARSSAQMDRLCRMYDTVYLHFLQPNQYLPGSKVLTPEEREVAYDPDFTGYERVPLAYPLLREEGRRLREDLGVRFVDLTQLYADEPGTIYNDFCCHVNQLGAARMAEAIAAAIPTSVFQ